MYRCPGTKSHQNFRRGSPCCHQLLCFWRLPSYSLMHSTTRTVFYSMMNDNSLQTFSLTWALCEQSAIWAKCEQSAISYPIQPCLRQQTMTKARRLEGAVRVKNLHYTKHMGTYHEDWRRLLLLPLLPQPWYSEEAGMVMRCWMVMRC